MSLCTTCLTIFATPASRLHGRILSGPHHRDVAALRAAAPRCRICKAIWLECVVGFGKEDWSGAHVETRYRVVQCSSERGIEYAVRAGRDLELRIGVERRLGEEEVGRDMVFGLVPCMYACGFRGERGSVSG